MVNLLMTMLSMIMFSMTKIVNDNAFNEKPANHFTIKTPNTIWGFFILKIEHNDDIFLLSKNLKNDK